MLVLLLQERRYYSWVGDEPSMLVNFSTLIPLFEANGLVKLIHVNLM